MAEQVAAPGASTGVDTGVEARLTNAGRVIRWIATGYAFIGLLGTVISVLRGFPSGPTLVRNLTPVSAIFLAGLTLGVLLGGDTRHAVGKDLVLRWVGVALCLGSSGFGVFIMAVFFANRTDIWGSPLQTPAFSVGVVLLVLGISLPLSISRVEGRVLAGQIGALLIFSLSAVIFVGYLYGASSVGRLFLRPEISFQAALTSILTAIGVFLIRPASGLLSTASSPGAGGRVMRWLGPAVLFLPAILLFIAENVPSSDRIDVLAFIAVGLGLFLLILLSVFVRALDHTAVEAATNAAQAERALIGLRQEAPVVTQIAEMLHRVDIHDMEICDVATRYRPGSGSVAGDASVVQTLPDGSVGAVLVDLTGHGALPAIWAIRLRDLLLHSLIAGASPSEAMKAAEWSAPGDTLASAMVLRLVPQTGQVQLCSAGHPPAIVIGSQEVTLERPTGPLLYLGSADFEETGFTLSNGDTLVAFSDGVADVQVTLNGQTEPEVLADILVTEGGSAARLADLVLGFAPSEPTDDQTVVVIRRAN